MWSIDLEGEAPDWLDKLPPDPLGSAFVPSHCRITLTIKHHDEPVLVLRNADELSIKPRDMEELGDLLRDLDQLVALQRIVRALASADDEDLWIQGDIFQGESCRYCDSARGMDHEPTCEHRMARELMGESDG